MPSKLCLLAKGTANYKKGDKMTMLAKYPDFNHPISESDFNLSRIRHQGSYVYGVANILSSNEQMDIPQTTFSIKIINI